MSDEYFFIIGIILACIGALMFLSQILQKIRCNKKVLAKVKSKEKIQNGFWHGKKIYRYFVSFTYLQDNKQIDVRCEVNKKFYTKCNKDKEVKISINPNKEGDVFIVAQASIYQIGIFLLIMGMSLITIYLKCC